jgi:DNA topoisomerase-1
MTQLERLQKHGIRRLGTSGRGFHYAASSDTRVGRRDLTRINALRIPPAWTVVAINQAPGALLQAVGMDAAGRWQYLYHENHIARGDRKKFDRLLKFAQALPTMRKSVARELRKPGLGRERVLACILRILSTCLMRPGSQVYASENGSYGIATLRPKHLSLKGDLVAFDFKGKSQVQQHQELKDRQVAKVVRDLLKHSAKELFKYENGDGIFVDIKRRHINEYIKEVMGDGFSAKDFRTWAGTLVCACALARAGIDLTDTKTAKKKKIVAAIKETAETLGNTPAVCRSAYICPDVLDSFERGEVIDYHFESVEALVNYRGGHLHQAERALLRLLKRKNNVKSRT